jgi:hypothetical protein
MSQFVAQPVICANPAKEETLGTVLGWMHNNLKSDSLHPIMQKHGLEKVASSSWYHTQNLLDVLREVYKEPEAMDIFVAIGKQFAKEYPFASQISTVMDAILNFNTAYHTLHRGIQTDEGILIQEAEPGTLIITNNTPWPGEIIFGLLFTLPSRFEPRGRFGVEFLEPDEYLRTVIGVTQK